MREIEDETIDSYGVRIATLPTASDAAHYLMFVIPGRKK